MRARQSGLQRERAWAETSRNASDAIFAAGITMLAVKTIAARSQEPVFHRKKTPERIVSLWLSKSEPLSITGSTLAGMYRIAAEMRNAHVRMRLPGLRACRCAPQRAHAGCARPLARLRRRQVSQRRSPSRA